MKEISSARLADIPLLCELLATLSSRENEFTPDTAKQSVALRSIIEHP